MHPGAAPGEIGGPRMHPGAAPATVGGSRMLPGAPPGAVRLPRMLPGDAFCLQRDARLREGAHVAPRAPEARAVRVPARLPRRVASSTFRGHEHARGAVSHLASPEPCPISFASFAASRTVRRRRAGRA
jgi:hypothetical protein